MTTPTTTVYPLSPAAFILRFALALLCAVAVARPGIAAEPAKSTFNLPADSAEKALRLFSQQAGLEVVFPSGVTKGVRTKEVKGEMPARAALDAMLAGTGLVVFQDEKTGAFSVRKEPPPAEKNGQSHPAERGVADDSQAADGVVRLSTFEVKTSADRGYHSTNSASITRLDAAVRELPVSVQIVNAEFMTDVGATTLFDLGRHFVGGNNQGASTNLTTFNLRGFADVVADDQQRDGFRFSGRPNLYNVDRVEIIRGPNSVVQGAADAGGQVNIVTKAAVIGRDFTKLEARTDSHGSLRGAIDTNLGAEIAGRRVALRVNAVAENGHSFIKFSKDNYRGLALAGRAEAGPGLTVAASFEYLREDRTPWNSIPDRWSGGPGLTGGFSIALNRQVPKLYNADEGNALAGPDSLDERESYYWMMEATKQFAPDLSFKLQVQGSDEQQDLMWPNNGNPALGYSAATNTVFVQENWQWAHSRDQRFNLRALANYNLHLDWTEQHFLLGASYLRDELRGVRDLLWESATNLQTSYPLTLTPGGITAAATRLDLTNRFWKAQAPNGNDVTSPSYYLNSTGSYLSGRLKTVLGYSWNKTERDDFIYPAPASGSFKGGTASAPAPTGKTTFRKTVGIPMLSGSFEIAPSVNVYANYSKSFKPQTAFLPTLNLTNGQIGPSLEPEEGQGYETGLKFDLLQNELSGSVAFYEIKKQNIAAVIDTNIVAALLGANVNQRYFTPGVEQTSRGVEVEVFYNPSAALTLTANYAYNDSWISANPAQPAQVGLEANVHFRHIANVAGKYTFQDGPLKGWFVGGNGVIRGRQYRYQGIEAGSNPGYAIWGLLAGYTGRLGERPYRVQLNVDNIFDREYLRTYAQIGEPVQWVLSAGFSF